MLLDFFIGLVVDDPCRAGIRSRRQIRFPIIVPFNCASERSRQSGFLRAITRHCANSGSDRIRRSRRLRARRESIKSASCCVSSKRFACEGVHEDFIWSAIQALSSLACRSMIRGLHCRCFGCAVRPSRWISWQLSTPKPACTRKHRLRHRCASTPFATAGCP